MKYTINDSGASLTVDVTVSYEKFSTCIGRALEMLSKQKNESFESVTAFIDKYGKGELDNLALNIAISDAFSTVVSENKLVVIEEPRVNVKTAFVAGGETCFSFEITKAPEFTLGTYKGLEIKLSQSTPSVTTAEIERKKQELLNSKVTWQEVDGALENGQMSVIDFEGSVDGVLFDGGSAQDYELLIGSGMFIPGFESQMVGMVKGETRIVKVTFPEQYTPELAGKDADFKVTLKAIKNKITPQINADFIAEYGKEKGITLASEDDLNRQLREEIYRQKNDMVQKEIAEKLENALYENTKIDLPESGIEFEAQYQLQNYKAQAAQYGMELEMFVSMLGMSSVDDLLNELREQARKQISLMLITAKIIEVEGLAASDEELEDYYDALAAARGMEVAEVKKVLPVLKLREHLETEKALKLVRDSANIIYK